MALKFFASENESPSLPFLNEFLEKNPKSNGQEYEVLEITLANSGKGYLAKTKSFAIFLWKNSTTTKYLLEALEIWVEQGHGDKLVCLVDKEAKDFHRLASDDESSRHWYCNGKKFATREHTGIWENTEANTNPFLKSSSAPIILDLSSKQNIPTPQPSQKRTSPRKQRQQA